MSEENEYLLGKNQRAGVKYGHLELPRGHFVST